MSNCKLSGAEKRRLLKSLPAIAESYFNGDMRPDEDCVSVMEFGLCFNNQKMYHKLGIDQNHGYSDISKILYHELGFKQTINLENSYPTPYNWHERAWFCLFLAEYLKGI